MSGELAHLLACLDRAVKCLDECMFDVDARVVEAHRAQLAKGREWYGEPIAPTVFSDGSTNSDEEESLPVNVHPIGGNAA